MSNAIKSSPDHQRSAVGLPRLGDDVVDRRRRDAFAAEQNDVGIGGKLRLGLGEDAAGLARRRVVRR